MCVWVCGLQKRAGIKSFKTSPCETIILSHTFGPKTHVHTHTHHRTRIRVLERVFRPPLPPCLSLSSSSLSRAYHQAAAATTTTGEHIHTHTRRREWGACSGVGVQVTAARANCERERTAGGPALRRSGPCRQACCEAPRALQAFVSYVIRVCECVPRPNRVRVKHSVRRECVSERDGCAERPSPARTPNRLRGGAYADGRAWTRRPHNSWQRPPRQQRQWWWRRSAADWPLLPQRRPPRPRRARRPSCLCTAASTFGTNSRR